ncbi:MAG: hypothetical protein QM769_09000 [Pseudoxanthomonas sp.]
MQNGGWIISQDRNMQYDRGNLFSASTKRLVAMLALAFAALASGNAAAQVQRAFQNLSFESPSLVNDGCRVYINANQVPGWQTNHDNYQTENVGCSVSGGWVPALGPSSKSGARRVTTVPVARSLLPAASRLRN